MKMLYDYIPANDSDTVSITSTSASSTFPVNNLKNINPVKAWKSAENPTNEYILYDAGAGNKFDIDTLFLNRFNFSSFFIMGTDDATFTTIPFGMHVSNVTKDEIYEEDYMHYWATLVSEYDPAPFNYRYLKLYIASQTPVFETTHYKIGNMLIGNAVDIWNPKSGYTIDIIAKNNVVEFDSGAYAEAKVGRTRRVFNGNFDKIEKSEYDKIRFSRTPMVMYNDWEGDPTKCYLVKPTGNFNRSYDYAQVTSHSFSFMEIV